MQQREGHLPLRHEGQIYTAHRLPFGTYFAGYRLSLGSLPAWPKPPVFARLEPIDATSLHELRAVVGSKQLIKAPAIQPRQTSLVDIGGSPDAILARFASKFRYNIKVAERHGIEVSVHAEDAPLQLPRFLSLLQMTAARQGFRVHSAEHYRLMTDELSRNNTIRLVFATKDGVDLAAMLMIVCDGTATYLHGASSELHKSLKAVNLMHWQAILHAKASNCSTYDLWGTHAVFDGKEWSPIPGHPSEGVTRFKLGLGGEIVEYPGSYDLVFQPFWYSAYQTLRGLRSGKRAFS